jgi:hypothetical protein
LLTSLLPDSGELQPTKEAISAIMVRKINNRLQFAIAFFILFSFLSAERWYHSNVRLLEIQEEAMEICVLHKSSMACLWVFTYFFWGLALL